MPTRTIFRNIAAALAAFAVLAGCSRQSHFLDSNTKLPGDVEQTLRQVSYEETVEASSTHPNIPSAPLTLDTALDEIEYWDITLDQAIQLALSNSSVLRDLGGRLIQSPGLTSTIYDPSLHATDPRFGTEAALSEFDAQFTNSTYFERNDRALNNALLGGGTNFFLQDLWRVQSELTKRAATGTQFSLRHYLEDDYNNAPANIFGKVSDPPAHAWTWYTDAEIRQPLLQGSGVEFNRIAGPDATPGLANGIVIARVNLEISSADFQLAVRDYLSNVENAYWELVFAYRDLEAKKKARDRSLESWQQAKALAAQGAPGAEDDKVAQAAEQYYRFQEEVETALSGRLVEGTRTFNGTTGGTFQGTGGVYVAERRLRLMIGVPINDNRLLRPVTDAVPASVVLNWDEVASDALARRTELVQQRLRVKRRNLELVASRNFLLPRLDAVGRYRRRGLGDALYDAHVPDPADPAQIADSGTDEWQIGLEMAVPIGFRQAHAGVRNAELALARERAVLAEMERQVVHDLSNAVAEQKRSFQLVQTAYNRRGAAERQFVLLASAEARRLRQIDFNLQLDAVRRLAEAETNYNRALVNYAVALKNVHVEAGNLMQYCNIHFADGG